MRRIHPLPIFSHLSQLFAIIVCGAIILGSVLQVAWWLIQSVLAWL